MRWSSRAAALAFLVATAVSAPVIAGPEQDKAQARQLAIDGVKAFDAGDYRAAIARFEAAEKLFHAPTHLLYVARGRAKLGELVAARETYLRIEREALDDGASAAFKKAQADAAAERAELEQKVPALAIRFVPADVQGAQVRIDGRLLDAADLGAVFVDPGKHRVEGRAGEREAAAQEIEVAEADRKEVVLDFGPSESAGAPAAPAGPAAPPPDAGGMQTTTILGISALGVGAVGLGVGAVLTIVSLGKSSDADALYEQCGGDACPEGSADAEEVRALDSDAATFGTIGFVSLGVGAAFAATGVVLLVVGGSDSPEAAGVQVLPSPLGGQIRGRF